MSHLQDEPHRRRRLCPPRRRTQPRRPRVSTTPRRRQRGGVMWGVHLNQPRRPHRSHPLREPRLGADLIYLQSHSLRFVSGQCTHAAARSQSRDARSSLSVPVPKTSAQAPTTRRGPPWDPRDEAMREVKAMRVKKKRKNEVIFWIRCRTLGDHTTPHYWDASRRRRCRTVALRERRV